uniref:hypothetical protein n=1 Tax=Hypnea nidulans TaxID=673449 RepID=UPI0027DA138C|nr:hypothetical protein REP55_pgp121 [Hypnea nidulans]WCH54515.1 hypothetical protein [Hypnea nidulans]
MTLTLKKLTNYLEGTWISNQTIYNLKNKKIYNNKFTTEIPLVENLDNSHLENIACITNNNNKYTIYQYFLPDLLNKKQGFINKIEDERRKQYTFFFDSTKVLKIINSINNVKYIEYVYLIDKNFKLSLGIIKIYDKYRAVCFTSDIKFSMNRTNSID